MRFRGIYLFTLLWLAVGLAAAAGRPLYRDASQPVEARVADLMSRMTLREKVLQLQNRAVGAESEIPSTFRGESYGVTHEMSRDAAEVSRIYVALQKYMRDSTRLGIPVITSVEGIQGILQNGATLFPHAIAQGSTFNPALIGEMTYAAGEEARAMGIHQIMSPVLDIARELRWGRVEETFGECPYLIAEMGTAFVNGYQKHRITCMPKHFAAHGTPSGGLNCAGVAGGPREFHSIYLYPFKKVIERCHPLAVMSCYSAYDGVPMSGSHYYMTDILRGQLGFDGYVYSDWGSVERLMTFHHAVGSREEAAMMALLAGIDLDVDSAYETLEQSVADGRISEADINRAVERILRVKFLLGLFDAPYGEPDQVAKVVRSSEHVALAKRVADESAVLLENNGILPLNPDKVKTVAVVGPNADQAVYGDYAWTQRDTREGVSLLEGMRDRLNGKADVIYAEGCDWWSADTTGIAAAVDAARRSDVVVAAIGTRSTFLGRSPKYSTAGEGFDLSSLELPGAQQQLLEALKATGKPLVVAFIAGKPLAMPWVKDNADAVICQWYAGEQQGNSLADILLGNVNPSGKLNVSFPRSTGNTPCFYNHYGTDREEPFDSPGSPSDPKGHYIFDTPEPLWNFGHGLSYTQFAIGEPALDRTEATPADTVTVTVPVANSGREAGKEVVQLYVHQPVSSVSTPKQQLRAFAKVDLKPGEEKTITLRLPVDELALYNPAMERVVEPGEYQIQIGNSSDSISFVKSFTVKP